MGRSIDMGAKQVSCDCGKTIRESSDDELVDVVQKHAREVHNMELTREQVLSMAEPV
jgi:predicted small metal-binding protein